MKMTTITAIANMRYNRSRNILIGIAICLTTLLLYLVPSLGYNAVSLQYGAVNELYPSWHAIYTGAAEQQIQELKVSSDIESVGVRYDIASVVNEESDINLFYFDKNCLTMNNMELAKGQLPEKEDEIVVSEEMLQAMNIEGQLGDRIQIPYQIRVDNGLDYAVTGEFQICGFLSQSQANVESKKYTGIVSEGFVKKNIAAQSLDYTAYIQVANLEKQVTADTVEQKIYTIADNFGIGRKDVGINKDYLAANYVDPSIFPAIIGIMVVIIVAAFITIYSIYYISMVQNVREYGRLKAIGATRKQLKQIVLREGIVVAGIAVPIGLILGSAILKAVIIKILPSSIDTSLAATMKMLVNSGRVNLYQWWIYVLAAVVTLCTVWLSLKMPMQIVGKISSIEAIRFHGEKERKGGRLKGYDSISVSRLAKRALFDNKKRTIITIMTLGTTGIFFMVVATLLSCINPYDHANYNMLGEYEIKINSEEGNKEHPEYASKEIQQNNPLNDFFQTEIERLKGVESVDAVSEIQFTCDIIEGHEYAVGLPEKYWQQVKNNIIEGNADYKDIKSGEKVVLTKLALFWYPELAVGDQLNILIQDGDKTLEKTVEIIAIADTPRSVSQYGILIMAKGAIESLCSNNQNAYFHVQAENKYDASLAKQLIELVDGDNRMQINMWQDEYDLWKESLALLNYLCYGFMAVLGAICIMNFANTMINSIHSRRKELGILQAIGLSPKQLVKMLQIESLVYMAGTFILSIGVGALSGYGVFLYSKYVHLFGIRDYHFPVMPVIILVVLIILLQLLISYLSAQFVKRDSLIDRIRLSE